MLDFENIWFDKFKPPIQLDDPNVAVLDEDNPEENLIQIQVRRDQFLQSFVIYDDYECEFIFKFDEKNQLGKLQLIKSRDHMLIEAYVPFELTPLGDITNVEIFRFPETGILASLAPEAVK